MRPRIGITTSYNDGRQKVDYTYIQAIEAAGGLPLIVPILQDEDAAAEFAALLDGLLMTGGPGITRGLIGALPPDLAPVATERDTNDERIYRACADKPIFGICYGMQFVNAMHGGTLYGDLNEELPDALMHSKERGADDHHIQIEDKSYLGQILRVPSITVNTYHKQAIASVGTGLNIAATAADGIVEALESDDGRIQGVQFHPEKMGAAMSAVFADFVARCRQS